jgi:hypothetical protein
MRYAPTLVGDLAEALEVDGARIGRAPAMISFGLVASAFCRDAVIVDLLVGLAHFVGHRHRTTCRTWFTGEP